MNSTYNPNINADLLKADRPTMLDGQLETAWELDLRLVTANWRERAAVARDQLLAEAESMAYAGKNSADACENGDVREFIQNAYAMAAVYLIDQAQKLDEEDAALGSL